MSRGKTERMEKTETTEDEARSGGGPGSRAICGPSGHHGEHVVAVQNRADDLRLARPQLLETEGGFERLMDLRDLPI